jgi:hypothetical protein
LFLALGGAATNQTEWPAYLGLTCIVLAVCVAASLEALHGQHKRIEELERKLSERQSPAEAAAAPNRGGM